MGLVIEDLRGKYEAKSAAQLEAVLANRYGDGVNSFWLSHEGQKYPLIGLMVRGEFAGLQYFPGEGHPGFVPAVGVDGLDREAFTSFKVNTDEEELLVSNRQVVSAEVAFEAVRGFLVSTVMPGSIEWMEL